MTTSVNKIRRNVHDKLKLIKMVNDNRILWDSRLPNFKGAEEEKTHAWQMIGNEFGVPGRRVARAFKSLRESYRRELALVKTMGEGFQSKWGLFAAMDFLREVIRERKSTSVIPDLSLGLTKNSNNNHSTKSLNRSSISDDYGFYVKTEPADLDTNPDNHISSTLNGNYDDIDDMTSDDSNQVHRSRATTKQNLHHNTPVSIINSNGLQGTNGGGNDVEELEAIDADFPYPLIIDNSPPSPSSGKRKRHNSSSDDDINPYDQSPTHNNHNHHQTKIQPTVREVLNSKFCGFISAKLNSMDDTDADNLMNRILMLLVQSQTLNGNSK
ncbi:uncharacterized protein LOC129939041 isoform X2 [Eupeodes corollae]|uniref:uncharacterized protein LOC129939041 isoform X2 n=1 Tax=Eupeodes corollae TaxID=290404 RepID=UPI0024935D73|nr:uncharacterized protein LOC129939041 isoform X2 [Eupeodes corollae]